MNRFSNDKDILIYEPNLFKDLHQAGQEISQGDDAQVQNNILTAQSADFVAGKVAEGMLVYLNGSEEGIDDVFEIISIISENEIEISRPRPQGVIEKITVPNCSQANYAIRTYNLQSREAFLSIAQRFGLRPARPDGQYSTDDILDASVLRQAAAYKTIAIIYAALSGGSTKEIYSQKSEYYQKLSEKAVERCKLAIDAEKDGNIEQINCGTSVNIKRV